MGAKNERSIEKCSPLCALWITLSQFMASPPTQYLSEGGSGGCCLCEGPLQPLATKEYWQELGLIPRSIISGLI